MEVNAFCSSLRDEMSGWRAKTQDIIRRTEGMSEGPGEKMKSSIDDMKGMIERIERTLERLERECPVGWDEERAEIERTVSALHARWNDTASYSPDDFE